MDDNLTFDDLLKARDAVFPPLYYATAESVERGMILYAKATIINEFVVFHPDDFEMIRKAIPNRRLVHLRDCLPIEAASTAYSTRKD